MYYVTAALIALPLMVSAVAPAPLPPSSSWLPSGSERAEEAPAPEVLAAPEAVAEPDAADAAPLIMSATEVAGVTEPADIATPELTVAAPLDAPLDIPTMIADTSARYGLDATRMLRIAWCESRYDPSARGAGGVAGLFQIAPVTWSSVTARMGLQGASPFDPQANTEVAAWLMATEGPRHWGCK